MTTYATLSADVLDYMVRNDLSGEFDTFLDLTEAQIRRSLKIQEMRRSVTQGAVRTSSQDGIVFDVGQKFIQPISMSAVDTSDNTISTHYYVPVAAFEEIASNRGQDRVFTINSYPTTVPAYSYRGVNMIEKTTSFSAVQDTKRFVMCLLVRPRQIGSASRFITFGNATLTVGIDNSGNLVMEGKNASDVTILDYVSTTVLAVDTWYAILIAVNMAGAGSVYIDGTVDAGTYATFTDDTLDLTSDSYFAVANATTKADMGVFGFLSEKTLNFSVSTIRERFFDTNNAPVPAGSQGILAFGEAADIWIPDGVNFGEETGIEPNIPLVPVDTAGDFPVISSQVEFLVNPAVDADTRLKLNYFEAFPNLDASDITTHWLIANNYDLYLYGCIAEAYAFIKNTAKENEYRQKMVGVFESIKAADKDKVTGRGPHIRRHPGRTKV